jgi:hypothetical protein
MSYKTNPVIPPAVTAWPTPSGKAQTKNVQYGYASVNPKAGGITRRKLD